MYGVGDRCPARRRRRAHRRSMMVLQMAAGRPQPRCLAAPAPTRSRSAAKWCWSRRGLTRADPGSIDTTSHRRDPQVWTLNCMKGISICTILRSPPYDENSLHNNSSHQSSTKQRPRCLAHHNKHLPAFHWPSPTPARPRSRHQFQQRNGVWRLNDLVESNRTSPRRFVLRTLRVQHPQAR